jgi:hypothetical protein
MEKLVAALVKAQSEFLAVKRGETAEILTKSGAKFSYQYANLETCIEQTKYALYNNGLAIIQTMGYKDAHTVVITKLLHISGQMIEGEQILECADPKDPQKVGSAITYLRRYGYMAILGIAAEDDNDNAAVPKPAPASPGKPTPKPAPKSTPAAPSGEHIKGELHQKTVLNKTSKAGKPYKIYEYIITTDGGQTFDTINSFQDIAANVGQSMKFSNVTKGYGANEGKYSCDEIKVISETDEYDIPFGED